MMNAQDLMTPSPIHVTPGTPLATCAVLLSRHVIRHLPVVDADGSVLGVVRDLDVFQHGGLLAGGGWISWGEPPADAGAVMIPAQTAGPYAPADEVLSRLAGAADDAVLVIGEGSRLVGIITEHDGVRLAQDVLSETEPARATPAPMLRSIRLGKPAANALGTMIARSVRHVLVIRGDRSLAGVVSVRDLISDNVHEPGNTTLIDQVIRRSIPVTASAAVSAAALARLMARQRIGCLPIINNSGQISGIVSRTDLLRQAADALRREA